ncbi:Protein G12 [Vespula maculifrons]|uniref:Protein G12 n=1 Tax=Vespula maculifrons TaxID=7453 RepID=A0ABD2AQR5_VESMC
MINFLYLQLNIIMKYILTFLAALVVVGVSAIPLNGNRTDLLNGNRSDIFVENIFGIYNYNNTINDLDKDLIDFVKLIPIDKLRNIVEKYKNDTTILNLIDYIKSKEFHKLVYAVEALPEHHEYVLYLQKSGYDKIRELKAIHNVLGMKDYVPPEPSHQVFKRDNNSEGGLSGLIKEYIAILPVKEIKELHEKKLKDSPAFAKFSFYIRNKNLVQILRRLLSTKDAQKLMKYILTFLAALVVVGVSAIPLNGNRTDLLNGNRSNIFHANIFGIFNGNESESNPLDKDFLDFLELLPWDTLNKIAEEYENNTDIIETYHFVMSKEFHNLVYAVEALPEHQRYVLYLQESGYDKIRTLQTIHKILGMKDYVPPEPSHQVFKRGNNSEGGLSGLIKKFIATLPVKEIKELHEKKLKDSPAFAKFISYLRDEKFSKIMKALIENETVKRSIKVSQKNGLDFFMKYILTFLAALVVVGVSANPLNGNRTDLLNGNRSNIFSENFLDIFNGNYTPSLEREFSDFFRLIPMDKVGEIFETYKNDPEIRNAIYYLKSDKLHQFVYAVEDLKEFHDCVLYLQEAGLDKIKQLKLLHLIFGMKDYVPPKPSHDVFKKGNNFKPGFKGFIEAFIGILPAKEIKELYEKKSKESETFAKFISYYNSNKHFILRQKLSETPEVQTLLKMLKSVGIDCLAIEDLHLRMIGMRQ